MLITVNQHERVLVCLALFYCLTAPAVGGEFVAIINVPPDIAPSSIGSDTQLNLFNGGVIGSSFNSGACCGATHNIEVNVYAGSVGNDFSAFDGSTINIFDGIVGNGFRALFGSTVNIFEGVVGGGFDASPNSTVNISGGEVGVYFDALPFSRVNISGGAVGDGFATFHGSVVTISGGAVGDSFDMGFESIVNVLGGAVGDSFYAESGILNISGGALGNGFTSFGMEVNISGGAIGDSFHARSNSSVNIFGSDFRLDDVPLMGLDVPGDTLALNLPDSSILSGTLADGTPFAFDARDGLPPVNGDMFVGSTLTLHVTELPPIGPAVVNITNGFAPPGVRFGQTAFVETAGRVGDHFNAGRGSAVILAGGQIGNNFEATGTHVTVNSGSIGDHFDAFYGSIVDITNGSVGDHFDAFEGSTVHISGGSVGDLFEAFGGSVVNIFLTVRSAITSTPRAAAQTSSADRLAMISTPSRAARSISPVDPSAMALRLSPTAR